MHISALLDAIRSEPFKPLQLHTDGRQIGIDHPEQIIITPDKATAVAVDREGHIHILDISRISSITVRPRRSRGGSAN